VECHASCDTCGPEPAKCKKCNEEAHFIWEDEGAGKCKCKDGYNPNADNTECERDPDALAKCVNGIAVDLTGRPKCPDYCSEINIHKGTDHCAKCDRT
jgi:hypothetical protein